MRKQSGKIKIVIIGFGSIGQRHYKNLLALGYKNVFVYDVDKSKIGGGVKTLAELSEKSLKDFKIAFVCNPTNEHIKTAIMCARAGCHLFIEKPLSHNLSGIADLAKICREKKLIVLIGCNMRFHPCLRFIKDYLTVGKLGKVWSIRHEFGHYLPAWRPGQDYKKNYAAKKESGGGIILDDIHEFDLLFWLADSKVVESKMISNKTSDLKIETEDQAVGIFLFENRIIGSVFSDYLSKKYRRQCFIFGEKGNLSWDFNKNEVIFENEKKTEIIFSVENFEVNNMYVEEIEYFLNCTQDKKETFNNIETAARILKFLIK